MKRDLYKPEPLDRSKRKGYIMDDYGWVLVSDGYPHSNHCYEIVTIKYEDGFEQIGWWTGYIWDTGRKIHRSVVIKWRFRDIYSFRDQRVKEDIDVN